MTSKLKTLRVFAKRFFAPLLSHTSPSKKGHFIQFVWERIYWSVKTQINYLYNNDSQKWQKKQKVYEQTYLLHCSKKQLLTEVARTPISQWKNCNYHVACLSSTRVSKLRSHLTCARRICCTDKTQSIFFCHCFQKITLKYL